VRDNVRTLLFAAILAACCSFALVLASHYTEPHRRQNEEADRVRNLLFVLEVPLPQDANAETLTRISKTSLREGTLGGEPIFEYFPDMPPTGTPDAVAIPFSGPGVWGQIHGILALESDLVTIRGVRFYKHEETPGLGGEIGTAWFQEQFAGKKLVSASGTAEFRVAGRAETNAQNTVDGITGATMTSLRVQDMLTSLAKYLSEQRHATAK
jgi:Na+-transporting NADH:ubiquinone oxidoreductase subunit C